MTEISRKCPCWKKKGISIIYLEYIHSICPTCKVLNEKLFHDNSDSNVEKVSLKHDLIKLIQENKNCKEFYEYNAVFFLTMITGPYYIIRGQGQMSRSFIEYDGSGWDQKETRVFGKPEIINIDAITINKHDAEWYTELINKHDPSSLYYQKTNDFLGIIKENYQLSNEKQIGYKFHDIKNLFSQKYPNLSKIYYSGNKEKIMELRELYELYKKEYENKEKVIKDNTLCECSLCLISFNCKQ
jgi:hypothetical protein